MQEAGNAVGHALDRIEYTACRRLDAIGNAGADIRFVKNEIVPAFLFSGKAPVEVFCDFLETKSKIGVSGGNYEN